MIPIRMVETDREDFGPVVELWRDDEFIGMVFHDGDITVAQIYPDSDGDVHDLDVANLMQVLELADQIVDPRAFDDDLAGLRAEASGEAEWEQEHPATVELVTEFDPQATYRSEDGEGFFAAAVALAFIKRCEELDLAVVELEGFDFDGSELHARPGLELVVRPQEVMGWGQFRMFANGRALESLTDWATRDTLVFAFVVQQPDGETFVA